MNTAIRITAVTGFLAVALGAIGAHGLQSALKGLPPEQLAKQLAWWHTAGQYHIIHAVAMLALALHAPSALRSGRGGSCSLASFFFPAASM